MNCPADATECGPITDPRVRIAQLVRLQRDREAGLVGLWGIDLQICVTTRELAMFLLARGHKPTDIMRNWNDYKLWWFWAAAKAELPGYGAAHRACR